MTLSDLLADVVAGLPESRTKALDSIIDEYGGSENCRFMLALLASATQRERRLARMLLRDLEIIAVNEGS